MKPYQRINHFPAMFHLSRKSNLAKHLKMMQKKFPEEYNFFPRTWNLPSEMNDFVKYYKVLL
jgi:tubulin polyglutamylase TTLL6/13